MKATEALIAGIVGKLEATPLSLKSLGEAFESTKRVSNIIELRKPENWARKGLYKADSRFIASFEMTPDNQVNVKCDWYRRTAAHDSYEHIGKIYNEDRRHSELTD